MSDADDDESEGDGVRRTVTRSYHGRSDREMNVIGWTYLLVLLVLLLPLLPFAVLLWLALRLLDAIGGDGR